MLGFLEVELEADQFEEVTNIREDAIDCVFDPNDFGGFGSMSAISQDCP